jgi:hypothetical protein
LEDHTVKRKTKLEQAEAQCARAAQAFCKAAVGMTRAFERLVPQIEDRRVRSSINFRIREMKRYVRLLKGAFR